MKALKVSILSFIIALSLSVYGQLDLSYKAVKMDSSINSSYSEIAPVFSPTGDRMYFLRINHPENKFGENGSQDIWCSKLVDGKWATAERLPDYINLGRYNAVYGVLSTGELVINGVFDTRGDLIRRGVSTLAPLGDDFNSTEALKINGYSRKSDGDIASISFDPSGTRMFLSFSKRDNSKRNHLYVSKLKKKRWSKPKKIKKLSSFKSDESPSVSPKGTTIYFSSNRGNKKGNFDIYSSQTSDIDDRKSWSDPVKVLGDVSGDDYDGFFVVEPKGEYAYFSSIRDGEKKSNIYKIQVKEIKSYVLVKGVVVNNRTGEKLEKGTPFSINVVTNGGKKVELDSLVQNNDSVYFEYHLPFGEKYSMQAVVDSFETKTVEIDLSKVSKYQIIDKNALVTNTLMLKLAGKIEHNDSIKSDFNKIELYANGKKIEDAVVSPEGTYKIELPTGDTYVIEAREKGYISFPINVDASKEAAISKTIDLKLEKIVDIKIEKTPDTKSQLVAKVLSRKDSTALKVEDYMVFIDGQPVPFGMLNKTKNGFDVNLEKGKSYFVMIKSKSYIETHSTVSFDSTKDGQTIEKEFYLVPIEVGATVQIENIYFDLGKAVLREESFEELDRLVEMLVEHKEMVIEVSGHTDNQGNALLNKKLSGERALAVRNYLVEKGIPEERMTSKGYGFDKPLTTNDTELNRAKNRRVEFMILSND